MFVSSDSARRDAWCVTFYLSIGAVRAVRDAWHQLRLYYYSKLRLQQQQLNTTTISG
jgi:hypothetical protein